MYPSRTNQSPELCPVILMSFCFIPPSIFLLLILTIICLLLHSSIYLSPFYLFSQSSVFWHLSHRARYVRPCPGWNPTPAQEFPNSEIALSQFSIEQSGSQTPNLRFIPMFLLGPDDMHHRFSRAAFAESNAPKKIAPPIEIQSILGPIPLNSAEAPSSFTIP